MVDDMSATDMLWKGAVMAAFLAGPSLSVFLGIYYTVGDLLIAAVSGFVLHFVLLAFSPRVSKKLVRRSDYP